MAVAAIRARDPGGQAVAGYLRQRAGGHVEHHGLRRGQVGERPHPDPRLDRSPVLGQGGRQRVGDRARASAGHRPSEAVAGDGERHAHRRAHRPAERAERVRGHAAEQGAGLGSVEQAGEQRGRHGRGEPEAHEPDGMPGHVEHRLQEVLVEQLERACRRAEQAPPGPPVGAQARRGGLERSLEHARASVVERVGQVDLGPAPLEPVPLEPQRVQEGRADRHRMDRGAVVVQDAGHGQLAGPRATADRVLGLQHRDAHARAGQLDRAREAVRPGADDDRVAHPRAVSARRPRPPITSTG